MTDRAAIIDSASSSLNKLSKPPKNSAAHCCSLILLVFLSTSFLHTLFNWFSYGQKHDAIICILSLLLAFFTYFYIFDAKKVSSHEKRLIFTFLVLIIWALSIPIVLYFSGFGDF